MAVAHRDWNACVDRGREMIQAFGADFSPPLMLMTRCIAATRAGAADPALTNRLALALLDELVAHPKPSPDLREQLFLTLRDLEMIRRAGGEDFATALREKMNASGVNIPGAKDR
jgi:hypothetical protein